MKILVANRGEIAVRIMRACRELGLRSVAVYSECDRDALHVRHADEAYAIGPSEARESYLHIDRLVDVARRAGVDAIHPGYGFLAENPAFARASRDAGLVFIGPSPDVIELMGGKTAARQAAFEAGVPVVPGTDRAVDETADVAEVAGRIGYPLLVKAVAGGGGKGMRLVAEPGELDAAVRNARAEAQAAFGNPSIYFERLLERPRHVEIQVLADEHGTIRTFTERECSIQRRHQKLVEEAPSIVVTPALREALASAAMALAARVGYTNAGTIEFLLDPAGRFYFLEMNTRLQVEHAVTEMTTGVDLVQWQLRIARGERLSLEAEQLLEPRGHAIECRIYAEDPDAGFIPSPGRIASLRSPGGPGIREDSGIVAGSQVPVYYDSMMAKLVAWGDSRPQALGRMRRALDEYDIRGVKTTVPFCRWLLAQPEFIAGSIDTTFVDRALDARRGRLFAESDPQAEILAVIGAALHAYGRVARSGRGAPAPAAWAQAARREALRG